MSATEKTVGGGPATGLAEEFVKFLQPGLGGTFGAGAEGQTEGIAGVLNSILSQGGGPGGMGINQLIQQQTERESANLRARFGAQGGTSRGTPAAVAEAQLRAEAVPRGTVASTQLQLQTLLPLLQLIGGTASQGIPQAQAILQPSGLTQLLQGLAGGAQGAGSLLTGIRG